jgi:hypothetical protein
VCLFRHRAGDLSSIVYQRVFIVQCKSSPTPEKLFMPTLAKIENTTKPSNPLMRIRNVPNVTSLDHFPKRSLDQRRLSNLLPHDNSPQHWNPPELCEQFFQPRRDIAFYEPHSNRQNLDIRREHAVPKIQRTNTRTEKKHIWHFEGGKTGE